MGKKTISNTFTVNTIEDGEDAYSVETNPATLSIECDANGNVSSNDYVTVLPKMYKGSTLVSSTLSNINGNKLVAVAGSSSEGIRIYGRLRVWKASGGGEVYTINEYPNVQVGETAYRWSTGDILVPYGTVTSTGTVYIVVNGTQFNRTNSSDTKIVNLTTPTTLSFTITSGGVSRNVEMQITGNKVGAQGKMSRNLYFAGMLSDIGGNNTFTATDHKAPYVDVETGTSPLTPTCYMYVGANGTNITFPTTAAAYQSSDDWEIMTSDFKYLITQAVFAEFAKLGSWIFNGDYMFSQHGIKNGQDSTSYEEFEGNETDAFQPNLYMNALTGRIVANDIVLRGVLNNMVQVINSDNKTNYGYYESASAYYINPLKVGQYVFYDISTPIYLPVARGYNSQTYIYGLKDVGVDFTLNEMRQMVGKKIYFLPNINQLLRFQADFALLMEMTTVYGGSGGTNDIGTFVSQGGTGEVVKEAHVTDDIVTSGTKLFYIAECKTGRYNNRECIYWEVEAKGDILI